MKKYFVVLVVLIVSIAALLLAYGLISDKKKINSGTVLQPQEQIFQVLITVVDEDGNLTKPDRVWWYYPSDGKTKTVEYSVPCVDSDCTLFGVNGAKGQKIYVGASFEKEILNNDYCFLNAYDATSVNLTDDSSVEVKLVLELAESCY